MTQEQSIEKYKEYLTGHIGNVSKALELLYTLDIPYVKEHIDELREIVKEHDASKYEEPEWSAYLHHFYPTNDEEGMKQEEFELACRHHIKNNKHHWDYWIDGDNNLIDNIDEEEYKLYVIERICDWLSMAGQHDEGPSDYWDANKEYVIQPDFAKDMCEEIFHKVPKDYSKDMWKITRGELDESESSINKKRVLTQLIKDASREEKASIKAKLKQLGYNSINSALSNINSERSEDIENIICNVLHKDKEEYLVEMKLSQIKQKSQNQDPRRIQKSRNVKTTYIGMSKFGILNFKTTSETRSGYHYQTIEFKDMKPFEDIIKSGNKIMPDDIKKNFQDQDVNIWCTDESFAFWAWAHQAYKNDFLYIDDRIPNLKKAIQAPKVNNVRLNGGACKHILSVIDYVMKPFVLLAISDDMNKYLEGNKEDKMQKQPLAVQNQYDMVAQWDWSEMEDYLGLSRIEIMSDLAKTLQIIPSTDKGDILTDIVGEALPNEEQGLKREIVDRLEDLIDEKEGS